MPQPIVIQLLSGPNLGRRLRYTEPPVTFGRDADNTVVLAEPFVSRRHGELVLDGDHWALVNQSANGTRVNGRLISAVGAKPRRLRSGDTIIVGNQPVFTVAVDAAAALADGDAAEAEARRPALSGRSKVWIGIGVYMLLMLGVFVFVSTLGGGAGGAGGRRPPEIAAADLTAEIRAPKPAAQPPNPGAAARYLQEAREWYARRDTDEAALFRAHINYQQSLAAANLLTFDLGLDQQQFLEVQDALVKQIEGLYRRGFNQLAAGNHAGAVETFDRLLSIYADKDSEIYRSAIALRAHAAAQQRKRR